MYNITYKQYALIFLFSLSLTGCVASNNDKNSSDKSTSNLIYPTSTTQLSEIITQNKNIVVDVYAEWCGPCKRLSPIINELAQKNKDILFVKINSKDEIAKQFGVRSLPTLIYFADGKEIHRSIGFMTKPALQNLLHKLFSQPAS